MSRIRRTSTVVVAAAAATLVATTGAHADKSSGGSAIPAMKLTDVTVIDARTVEATFSNPLAASSTDLSLRVFHAPHFNHPTPHSHEAAAVTLLNEGRTARVSLTRNLHPKERLCSDQHDPRCSTARIPWVVTEAKDIYGQSVSNHHWKVWAVGSHN